jgi:2,5-diketo-D-gluconate reductase A
VRQLRERDVVLEGYSGLRGGTLENDTIRAVAERLGRTPAQVIVRWHLQHGFVVIPKSSKADRIRANADVADFELPVEDMAALDGLAS